MKTPKSAWKLRVNENKRTEYTREGKSPLEMHRDREQMQQRVQDNGRVLWQPLDTKSNDHTTSKSLKADI